MQARSKDGIVEGIAASLRRRCRVRPVLGLILGSGFKRVSERVEVEFAVSMDQLPGFPKPSVGGHAGQLLLGTLGGLPVGVLSGRSHFYEGHSMEEITRPVRALAALGVQSLLVTNAAGAIRKSFRPGDLMRITDHINLMGQNPLRGPVQAGLDRFVDLTRAYDDRLSQLLQQAARSCRVKLQAGVYLAVAGPSYETPAEIRAFRRWGADAVGMSTVPEVIVARQHGLAVAGLSCLTNLAADGDNPVLAHADVLAAGDSAGARAAAVLERFARLLRDFRPGPRASATKAKERRRH
jgi:purine-nucleoside phosphorylase